MKFEIYIVLIYIYYSTNASIVSTGIYLLENIDVLCGQSAVHRLSIWTQFCPQW